VAVLNGVLRNATQVNGTVVTGGDMVDATGAGQIPALYAQAYTSLNGQLSVVISNKSGSVYGVTIRVNGVPVSGTLPTQFLSGGDPAAANTAPSPTAVSIQTAPSANPVTVPAYSVVRVDLSAPPVVTAVNSASYATGPVAPQEIVTLFGTGIATQSASTQTPAASLGGISVQIANSAGGTQLAPLFSVTPNSANLLIPSQLAAGPAKITVLQGSIAILTGSITIASPGTPAVPGLYSMNQDGAGVAAAVGQLYSANNQIATETVFTCAPGVPRSCLGAPLSFGGATAVRVPNGAAGSPPLTGCPRLILPPRPAPMGFPLSRSACFQGTA